MNITPYKQTQLVIWFNQLFFLLFIIINFNIWLIPLAIVMLYIFGAMSEISLHRYYTHKSYKTTNAKEKLLRVFSFLTGQGAVLSWVTVHRTHHAYEDTEKDPHSPAYMKWWEIYLAYLPQDYKNNLVLDLMRTPAWKYFVFENKYYFLMWCCLWCVSAFVSLYLFYVIVAGSAMWYIATCIINIVSHSTGVKKYSDAVAYNSSFINLITGVGHHNNHHKFPKSHTYSVAGEVDLYGRIIEKFFMIH